MYQIVFLLSLKGPSREFCERGTPQEKHCYRQWFAVRITVPWKNIVPQPTIPRNEKIEKEIIREEIKVPGRTPHRAHDPKDEKIETATKSIIVKHRSPNVQ